MKAYDTNTEEQRKRQWCILVAVVANYSLLSVWLPAQPTPTVWLYGSMAALSVQHVVNIVGANLAANMTIITTIAIVRSNTIDDNVL